MQKLIIIYHVIWTVAEVESCAPQAAAAAAQANLLKQQADLEKKAAELQRKEEELQSRDTARGEPREATPAILFFEGRKS